MPRIAADLVVLECRVCLAILIAMKRRPEIAVTHRRQRLRAFGPIGAADARVLVLGSMPGPASLAARQYYANPANCFWQVMARLTGVPADASYAARCEGLKRVGLALWDVVAECRRIGSSDQAIERDGLRIHDVAGWLRRHPLVEAVVFNGGYAEQMFRRRILCRIGDRAHSLRLVRLPSTSPAHATRSSRTKVALWCRALRALGITPHCGSSRKVDDSGPIVVARGDCAVHRAARGVAAKSRTAGTSEQKLRSLLRQDFAGGHGCDER